MHNERNEPLEKKQQVGLFDIREFISRIDSLQQAYDLKHTSMKHHMAS